MQIWNSLKMLLWLTLITGGIYPISVTFISHLAMRDKAEGSFAVANEKKVGSLLIAQRFTDEKYFWPRPSTSDFNAMSSGGSNLGPTSRKLQEQVKERRGRYASGAKIPSELLFASGSGLDPHIGLMAAYFQAGRVAKARGKSEEEIRRLIDKMQEKSLFRFLERPYVNVLKLNIALDESR